MNEEILDKYYSHLRQKYRKHHTRRNNYKFTRLFLKWILENKGKTYLEIEFDDMQDYKAFCNDNYKVNGNVGRLSAVNNFVSDFLEKPELRVSVPKSVYVNKQVLSDEEIEQYKNAAETPLEKLIVTYQVDGLLRPGEFYKLRKSLHDFKNQTLSLDDTKTGNNSVIITPNMMKAYYEYISYRTKPRHKKDQDKLIIIPKGSHYGLPLIENSDYIYRHTKIIAARAGFKRSVYPYLIKPSAITDGFNKQVNPKILKRQARHSKIESTLRYDHTDDKMVKDHFNKVQRNVDMENITPEDKARVWMDKLLSKEIDLKTFKTGIDVLLPKKHDRDDVGYV